MTDEEDERSNFDYMSDPALVLASKLKSDIFIDNDEAARFLRENPPGNWPAELTEHIAGLIDGTSKRSVGRPDLPKKDVRYRLVNWFYPGILKIVQGNETDWPVELVETIRDWASSLDQSFANHEKAKFIVSMMIFGNDAHVREVQDLYDPKLQELYHSEKSNNCLE